MLNEMVFATILEVKIQILSFLEILLLIIFAVQNLLTEARSKGHFGWKIERQSFLPSDLRKILIKRGRFSRGEGQVVMIRLPAARFLIVPFPPGRLAARFLAAVILPPLVFFAISNLQEI